MIVLLIFELVMGNTLWPEKIIEVEPSGTSEGTIVWEWHVWDHLVQDHDPSLPNYGDPSDYPHRLNINYTQSNSGPKPPPQP